MARSPKGDRMPDNRYQYEIMARLFEKALLREQEINSKLRSQVNDLKNKLTKRGAKHDSQPKTPHGN